MVCKILKTQQYLHNSKNSNHFTAIPVYTITND